MQLPITNLTKPVGDLLRAGPPGARQTFEDISGILQGEGRHSATHSQTLRTSQGQILVRLSDGSITTMFSSGDNLILIGRNLHIAGQTVPQSVADKARGRRVGEIASVPEAVAGIEISEVALTGNGMIICLELELDSLQVKDVPWH